MLDTYLPFILLGGGLVFLIVFFHYVPFFLWLSAKVSGVHISLIQLLKRYLILINKLERSLLS